MQPEIDFPTDLRALEQNYELIRELGHGGMAAVYLARRRDTGKLVAIKAIRARYLDDPDALQRFAREARTVAHLSHPNIVATQAIEQIGDRAVAIIMEYFAGGTVRDRLRDYGAFSAEMAESVIRDVASALRYAHERGIVHRDVKPENVFLDRDSGRALLSDFGIARRIEGDAPITMLGASLGTPQYMSPEQIDGAGIDGRADIYSLGVLGWELLTGQRPWAGENLYGVIYKQKHEELPRITTLRPRVPANLLFAIEGALVKNRDRRWQSIDEFLDQLTYSPPPVLAQANAPPPTRPSNEPTVKFRRTSAMAEPNEPIREPARPTTAPRTGPTVPAPRRNAAAPPVHRGRRRVLQGLGLVVPLAIAGVAWYILVDPRSSAGPTQKASGDVASSAGTIASDSVRPDAARRDSARPVDSTRKADVPTPRPSDSVARSSSVPRRSETTRPAPSSRCASPSTADQRACLLALIAANDSTLQRTYDSLIVELRHSANVRRGGADPLAVRQLRVEQRTWVASRDFECRRESPPVSTRLWARPLSVCFARLSAARAAELQERLARGRPQ
jgi:serine/threonine protein kinase